MNQFHLFLVTGLSAVASTVFLPLATAHAESPPNAAVATTARSAAPVHRLGQHPAVLVQAKAQGIDPNHFIVQPPASVTWRVAPEADLRWAAPVTATPADTLGNPRPSAATTSVASQGS